MKNKHKIISIREFGFLHNKAAFKEEGESLGSFYIGKKDFEELESFVLTEKNQMDNEGQPCRIMEIRQKSHFGKIIQVQNYVGVVQTRNGTTIEILPKISDISDIEKTRKIFLKMLKTLKDSPFKNIGKAYLKTQKFPIFEIFISLFVDEIDKLIKKGIKKNYVHKEENRGFVKGKLKIAQNIRKNLYHKEKFFCGFDEFTENIIENMLIKKCLIYLLGITKNEKNRIRLKELSFVFGDIKSSTNVKNDIKNINKLDRLNNYYAEVLQRVKIFLLGQSVVNFAGNTLTLALLFPMEKIFESYVAKKIIKKYPEWGIKTQDTSHYLIDFHKGKPRINIRPDMVANNGEIIIDTKRKVLNKDDAHYGIVQMDMQQMYIYAKKYSSEKVYLIYPTNKNFTEKTEPFYLEEGKIMLKAIPYDLENDVCDIS